MTRATGTETLFEEAERLEVQAAARSWAPYPEYREGGAEWLGQVPSHWQGKRLKYAVHIINEKVEDANGLPYVGLEHIESWTGRRIESDSPVSPDGVACRFDKGDVLFGKLRPYLAKAHLAVEPGVCTAEALVLRPTLVRADYLRYYALTRQFIEVVDGSTYGSKMPRANWQFIGGLPCLIPPSSEQRAIAAFLDRKTRRIDELIEKKRRLIDLLQEKRTALISHAVTKGLNSDAPMKPSGIDWLGDIPAHWDAERIKWVAKLESGHTPDKKVPEYWVDCDVPWVSLNDTKRLENGDLIDETTNQVNAAGLANSSARILPAGAVVFSRDATIGRCGITTRPMAVSQHFIAWLCGNRLDAKYLLFVLRSMTHELNRITEGATVKTIGMTDVKLLATPVPPIEEQKAIVAFIERERSAVDVLIDMAQAAVARLTEYREGLISAAVTGKIDVREEATA